MKHESSCHTFLDVLLNLASSFLRTIISHMDLPVGLYRQGKRRAAESLIRSYAPIWLIADKNTAFVSSQGLVSSHSLPHTGLGDGAIAWQPCSPCTKSSVMGVLCHPTTSTVQLHLEPPGLKIEDILMIRSLDPPVLFGLQPCDQ